MFDVWNAIFSCSILMGVSRLTTTQTGGIYDVLQAVNKMYDFGNDDGDDDDDDDDAGRA